MAQQTSPLSHQGYDLDDVAAFKSCTTILEQPNTDNFIVSFNSTKARCAIDVTQEDALKRIQGENRDESQTLWLNFWASESQRPIIEAVAKHYGISPRLAGLLCPTTSTADQQREPSSGDSDTSRSSASGVEKASRARTTDVEKAVPTRPPSQQTKPSHHTGLENMTFGKVVESLWHFCSVDFGRRYIYIGFNALYSLPEEKPKTPGEDDVAAADDRDSTPAYATKSYSKPSGQRIWSSVLICDDGTIISVFERPEGFDKPTHHETRWNVLNVFRHLSQQHNHDNTKDALMKVRVRWNDNSSNLATGHDRKEAASLLFYYLFDDWVSTFKLIARVEHPYREKLETLRQKMLQAAKVELVNQVHVVGRQLTVLKLMYQSYELIVSRLIQSQRMITDPRLGPLSPQEPLHEQNRRSSRDRSVPRLAQYDDFFTDDDTGSNVRLSSSALVRFERLFDRIRLYALTEIEECIKEKEALVMMNFNLVALKESQAVEKLTRTTILLAKATILFLPVSLMTAYFSIQLKEIQENYTLKTYWLCFLVVGILSVLFLVIFGGITHTLEGKTVYRSVTRTVGRRILNMGRRKPKAQ